LPFLVTHAAPLIRSAYDDATGRELYRAAGGLAALAGICAYDADLHGAAQRYYFQALRMAKASGDRGFGGYVMTRAEDTATRIQADAEPPRPATSRPAWSRPSTPMPCGRWAT
jgi:hypothetical protein